MPTIQRLSACKICIYAADHLPPHFHILANNGNEALVAIATLQVLQGNAGKQAMQQALDWAQDHTATLQAAWQEYNT